MPARYPTGLTGTLPEPDGTTAWPQLLTLALDDQPLGRQAPCLNPECDAGVEYDPDRGRATLYCSPACRTRTSRIRTRATQQLHAIETALGPHSRHQQGLPREELRARARHLKWWLAHLTPPSE